MGISRMANLFQPSLVRATTSNGAVASGAKMYFYLTGTSTPTTAYTDQDGLVAATNPVVASSAGLFAPTFLDPDTTYRVLLTTSAGTTIWDVDPVRGFDETQLAETAADAIAAGASAVAAAAAAATSETNAETAQGAAEDARDDAIAAALGNRYYPGARSYVPQGLTAVAITAAGSGGTNGTYTCPLTGDNLSVDAYATVVVSGGAVTSVSVAAPGLYVGNSLTIGSVDTSAIVGLTGETVSATGGYLVTSGQYYLTDHASDTNQVALFQNQANVATEVDASVDWMNVAAAAASATAAASSASTAASSATGVAAGLGPLAASTSTTLGTTDASGGNIASSGTEWEFSGDVVASEGVVTSLSMNWSASATVELIVIDAVSRVCRYVLSGQSMASGANTLTNPFGSFVIPANSLIGVRRTAGTGLLKYATVTDGGWKLTSATYAVGDVLPALTSWGTVQPTISFSVSTVSDSLDTRLDRAEVVTPTFNALGEQGSETRSYTVGHLGITRVGDISNAYLGGIKLWGDCVITGATITFNSAGKGYLELWRRDGGNWKLAHRKAYTVSATDNSLTVPNWQANAGSYLCWRRSTGTNVTYGTGNGFRYVASPGADEIGATTSSFTTFGGYHLNFQATVTLPKRRSYRSTRSATSAPTTVEFQQFPSTTTPAHWSIASPFAVSDGLGATGAGGWDKVATFQPEGLGYSSIRKRRLVGRVKITDTASQVGICTQSLSTDATLSGGTALIIDGVAGALRLYRWNGTSTAGTLATGTTFTSALVSGVAYTLELILDGYTITGKLTDCLNNVITTVTASTFYNGSDNRVHGRPGIMHLAGTVNWEWVRFAHDVPRNVRAVVIGDSNAEGTSLSGGNAWVAQLNTSYGTVVNASRATETSINMVSRLADLSDLRPQYAIMAMGTNDTSQSLWRLAVKSFIDAAEMIGAEPILVIPPPYVAKQATITALSGDITGYYFGCYRYIDFLGAMSNANDRLTWNSSYVAGDGVHYTTAGQTRAVAQAIADIPELAA